MRFSGRIQVLLMILLLGGRLLQAQNDIGFIESFALASDRGEALGELIPGTDDYFYYYCLHQQNNGQLAQAKATIDRWRGRQPQSARLKVMAMRQALLEYDQEPGPAIEMLRRELGVRTNHAAPRRDPSKQLSSKLDNAEIEWSVLFKNALARDRNLGKLRTAGLPGLVGQKLSDDQVRQLVSRLNRSDVPGTVELVARELATKGSRGFGWAPVHRMLTLEQLDQLSEKTPSLLGNDKYVREYLTRLLPRDGESVQDSAVLLPYLTRLKEFTDRLPASQLNLKALVVGNLLKFKLSQGQFDKALFVDYLRYPSNSKFYNREVLRTTRARVDLAFQLSPHVALKSIGDDSPLVRHHLEHFLKAAADTSQFDAYVERNYLDRVFAETKIVHAIGDSGGWYSMLSPEQQKELRDRIELRFAADNKTLYSSGDDVVLKLECKNVDEVVVKVYRIELRNYYRSNNGEISTDIDLDGLVSNQSQKLEFSFPADLRHAQTIHLPELSGSGVWVVDILGGGVRSRALVRKGGLSVIERMSDAGPQFCVVDSEGHVCKAAKIELGSNVYQAGAEGWITLPFAEKRVTRRALIVNGDFAQQHTFAHATERYQLFATFAVDRESLISGVEAAMVVSTRLSCNGRPVDIELLEDVQLKLTATTTAGTATSQTTTDIKLSDAKDFLFSFNVPAGLAKLEYELSGKVVKASNGKKQSVESSGLTQCNGIIATSQIYDAFLTHRKSGYGVAVMGRNGEPADSLPVVVKAFHPWLVDSIDFKLATDEQGEIALGEMQGIEAIIVQSDQLQDTRFILNGPQRAWPPKMHSLANQSITLPLGSESTDASTFSLHSVRGGRVLRNWNSALEVGNGAVRIAGLDPGDYRLQDFQADATVEICVEDGQVSEAHVVGAGRVLALPQEQAVFVRRVVEQGDKLQLAIENATAATRVHVCATTFAADVSRHSSFHLPVSAPSSTGRRTAQTYYVDSLRLDEEYGYILNRRGGTKFPGNMLVQPSLLIHPWEIAKTTNLRREARDGDRIPDAAAAPMAAEAENAGRGRGVSRPVSYSKSFEHLAKPSVWLCNIPVVDGIAEISLDQLKGYGSVAISVVHPSGGDFRHLPLKGAKIEFTDLRLKEAFDPSVALGQTEGIQKLAAGETVEIGGSYSQQFQLYDSLGDVIQLYNTILSDSEFAKYRFLGDWQQLSQDEKRVQYSNHACHELNLFLYRRDPDFFKSVVRPFVEQKAEKQFVDLWLLDKPLDPFLAIDRFEQLNALERVLFSKRNDVAKKRTLRWLSDNLAANPVDRSERKRLFGIALLGSALSAGENLDLMEADSAGAFAGGGFGGGGATRSRLSRGGRPQAKKSKSEDFGVDPSESLFGMQRKLGRAQQLFESLPATKKWAETNYLGVQLQLQSQALIGPSPFWMEVLEHDTGELLPRNIELACRNRNEALCALAWVDLPEESAGLDVKRDEDKLLGRARTSGLLVREAIEPLEAVDEAVDEISILVGQEIYDATVADRGDGESIVAPAELVRGNRYKMRVVVTNPSNRLKHVSLLVQLPQGSLPLEGSQSTTSNPVDLPPYGTQQFEYAFYFPLAGEFTHYGAQVSESGRLIAAAKSERLSASDEPAITNTDTWQYVADWGDTEQVVGFLRSANLEEIDLGRIAFRMADKAAFESVVASLRGAGQYEKNLWGYALVHRDEQGIQELVSMSGDLLQRLGAAIESPIVSSSVETRRELEHLDFRPLVVARVHQLGAKRLILNPELRTQYLQLLNLISHQASVSAQQRMQLCYYMLLQGRIEEAIRWFDSVDPAELESTLQYAYFDAYLEFYRGGYDRAHEIATDYEDYPVTRWRDLFASIRQQVETRRELLATRRVVDSAVGADRKSPTYRGEKNDRGAGKSAVLAVTNVNGKVEVQYENIDELRVNYYEMDIELLFSRRPFVAMSGDQPPAIAPNQTTKIACPKDADTLTVELPADLKNRNMIIEVSGGGLSKSLVLTAGELEVDVAGPFGQVRVRNLATGAPAEAVYVKVYARQAGQVKFYKDGYTDLRGYFDYASLSTNDLDSVERFAILVLDEKLGAVVLEAGPPTR